MSIYDSVLEMLRLLYPQKPWWERWCFVWRCIGVEMRHGYGPGAWGIEPA